MVTPNDIQNKVFSNAMRGYNKREVDEFLDEITIDFQKQLDENAKMAAEIKQLNAQIEESKKTQQSVANTLEQAKRLMSDISESAEKRAEVIIKNARLDAQTITRNAKDSVESFTREAEMLQRKIGTFKADFRDFMQKEQQKVEDNVDDLFSDLEGELNHSGVVSGQISSLDSLERELKDLPDADDILAKAEKKAMEADEAEEPGEDMDRTKVMNRVREPEDLPEDLSRTIVMDRSTLSHTDFDFRGEEPAAPSQAPASDEEDFLKKIDEEVGTYRPSSAGAPQKEPAFDEKAKTIVVDEKEILSRLK